MIESTQTVSAKTSLTPGGGKGKHSDLFANLLGMFKGQAEGDHPMLSGAKQRGKKGDSSAAGDLIQAGLGLGLMQQGEHAGSNKFGVAMAATDKAGAKALGLKAGFAAMQAGQQAAGELADGTAKQLQAADAKLADGKQADAKSADGKLIDAKLLDAKSVDDKALADADAKLADGKQLKSAPAQPAADGKGASQIKAQVSEAARTIPAHEATQQAAAYDAELKATTAKVRADHHSTTEHNRAAVAGQMAAAKAAAPAAGQQQAAVQQPEAGSAQAHIIEAKAGSRHDAEKGERGSERLTAAAGKGARHAAAGAPAQGATQAATAATDSPFAVHMHAQKESAQLGADARNSLESSAVQGSNVSATDVNLNKSGKAMAQNADASAAPRSWPVSDAMQEIARVSQHGNTKLELTLEPAHLGKVQVTLQTDASKQIQVLMHVDQPHARHLIEQQLPVLRQALEQQGLSLGNFSMDGGNGQQQSASEFAQRSGQPASAMPAADSRAVPVVEQINAARHHGSGISIRI